jgi:predicted DNA-binding protein with PD1-like motif
MMEISGIMCHAAVGRSGRLLAARLLPDQDLIEGITALIRAGGFRSGAVTAIGSLKSATVVWARKMKLEGDLMDASVVYEMPGPVELGLAHGYFGFDQEGGFFMHLHGIIQDKEGRMRCGNVKPGSAPVLATVELTIQEFEGLDLNYTLDEEWKHKFPKPRSL